MNLRERIDQAAAAALEITGPEIVRAVEACNAWINANVTPEEANAFFRHGATIWPGELPAEWREVFGDPTPQDAEIHAAVLARVPVDLQERAEAACSRWEKLGGTTEQYQEWAATHGA